MDEVSSYVRLNLPFVSLRQGRPKDCSTSSSNPMMEGPWCRVRREARARERHRHCSSGKASKRLTPAGRLEKRTKKEGRSLVKYGVATTISPRRQRKLYRAGP